MSPAASGGTSGSASQRDGLSFAASVMSPFGLSLRHAAIEQDMVVGELVEDAPDMPEAGAIARDGIARIYVRSFAGLPTPPPSGLITVHFRVELVQQALRWRVPALLLACWPESGDTFWCRIWDRIPIVPAGETCCVRLRWTDDRLDDRFGREFRVPSGAFTLQELSTALATVICTLDDAEMLCWNALGEALDAVAGRSRLDVAVIRIVEHAHATGRVSDLVSQALSHNPGSSVLKRLAGGRLREPAPPVVAARSSSPNSSTVTVEVNNNVVKGGVFSVIGTDGSVSCGGQTRIRVAETRFEDATTQIIGVKRR